MCWNENFQLFGELQNLDYSPSERTSGTRKISYFDQNFTVLVPVLFKKKIIRYDKQIKNTNATFMTFTMVTSCLHRWNTNLQTKPWKIKCYNIERYPVIAVKFEIFQSKVSCSPFFTFTLYPLSWPPKYTYTPKNKIFQADCVDILVHM